MSSTGRVRRLHPDFAVALVGLDLARDLSADVVRLLASALRRERVVVVPGQRLRSSAQLRVGAALGALYGRRRSAIGRWYVPEVRFERGDDPSQTFYNEQWHSDLSWAPRGHPISLLYAVEAANGCTSTAFADMVGAYRSLDESSRAVVAGWRAHHHVRRAREVRYGQAQRRARHERDLRRFAARVIADLRSGRPPFRAVPAAQPAPPGALHAVVQTDAVGRTFLFAGDHAWALAGMDEREGLALLEDLQRRVLCPPVVYEHRWQTGDLVLFDNRSVLHRRTPDGDPSAARVLRRCIVWRDGVNLAVVSGR